MPAITAVIPSTPAYTRERPVSKRQVRRESWRGMRNIRHAAARASNGSMKASPPTMSRATISTAWAGAALAGSQVTAASPAAVTSSAKPAASW